MTINYRIRNIVIAAVLAATAGLLTVIYITSSKSDAKASKESVRVYVPSKDFGIGTAGSKVTDAMTTEVVTRDQLVSDAVTSPAQIKVAVPPILAAITMGRKKAEPLIRSRRAISDAIG